MKCTASKLHGAFIIEPVVHGDERGYFLETYNKPRYEQVGITDSFVQDNHSSSKQGILRGLHLQLKHPQSKLVRVVRGKVYDVALDLRANSPTYLKWEGVELSAENFRQFYIPKGMAHGFYVMSDWAQFEYKCSEVYHPEDEISLRWNDPAFSIEWPVSAPILSGKDAEAPLFEEYRKAIEEAYRSIL